MRLPSDFSVYDPAHVTLHLLQSLHSAGIRSEQETERSRDALAEERKKFSEASNVRDERERELTRKRKRVEDERDNALESFRELKKILEHCAQLGRSDASKYAAKELERWQ